MQQQGTYTRLKLGVSWLPMTGQRVVGPGDELEQVAACGGRGTSVQVVAGVRKVLAS